MTRRLVTHSELLERFKRLPPLPEADRMTTKRRPEWQTPDGREKVTVVLRVIKPKWDVA